MPFLANTEGVLIEHKRANFIALQLTGRANHPHLLEDAVGQLFLFDVAEGNIRVRRKPGLTGPWQPPRWVTQDGQNDYPWAAQDSRGSIILAYQSGADGVQILR